MDELERQFDQMINGAKELKQKKTLSFEEIFTDSFVSNHTVFSTMNDFWISAGIHNTAEYDAYPDEKLNDFVNNHSMFSTFEEMFDEATNDYVSRRLGL